MDNLKPDGVLCTPLKIIDHGKGSIFHGIKKGDEGYVGFGEAYFSEIKWGEVKGWNKHKKMTLNLIVPIGEVAFVIYNEREGQFKNNYFNYTISSTNYFRLTIPPGLWIAFKGKFKDLNLVLNIADLEHDPQEIVKCDLNKFPFDFDSL